MTTETETVPLCIDCKHYRWIGSRRRKDIVEISRVTGRPRHYEDMSASVERLQEFEKLGTCGPSGRYFSPNWVTRVKNWLLEKIAERM